MSSLLGTSSLRASKAFGELEGSKGFKGVRAFPGLLTGFKGVVGL